MYQVGANNPNVGNDRRNQLLQTLFQQFQQRQSQQQQVGSPAAGSFDFLKKRAQSLLPSSPTRSAGAGRDTSGSVMTQGTNIPGNLHDSLGPGGDARAASFGGLASMPSHISGYASSSGQSSPIPGGSMIGMPPTPPAIMAQAPIPPGQVAAPGGSVGTKITVGPDGSVTGPDGAPYTPSGPEDTQAPNTVSALGNLVPLGNGMFINPSSGQIFGGNGAQLPMGSLLAHFAAGRGPQ